MNTLSESQDPVFWITALDAEDDANLTMHDNGMSAVLKASVSAPSQRLFSMHYWNPCYDCYQRGCQTFW